MVASLVVPPLCASCREPEFGGVAVCEQCVARLVPLPETRCARCGAPSPRATAACRECSGRSPAFAGAWAPFAYKGVGRSLVRALKNRGAVPVAAFMASQIAARAPAGSLDGQALVPIPAHPRRRRRHGFNQAESIARSLHRITGLPVISVLGRDGRVAPQVGLERRARLANARGSVRARSATVPARAVLVDDVYTTGATLDACARALSERGASEVVAVTFARAVRG